MTEPDAVEQVLAGIGRATPAGGIEARVLARLAAESSNDRPGHPWTGWLSHHGWHGVTVACVAVVLLGGVGVSLVRHSSVKGSSAVQQAVPLLTVRELALPATNFTTERPQVQNTYVAQQAATSEHIAPRSPRLDTVVDSTAGLESFPAPPMPLTRQERLLLRMLAGGEQAELVATLAPGAAPLVRSKDDAAFSTFFAPAAVDPDAASGNVLPPPDAALVLSTESRMVTAQQPTEDEHGGKTR